MKTIGFIDYYLDEWHANNYPKFFSEASGGEMRVKYAYGKIDSPIGGRTNQQWCRDQGIELVGSIEEIIERCDCINVLSPDNPEMHEELCEMPLKSGKPVYVDKTFAETRASAEKIFEIAESHGTPCFSASALRFAAELDQVDKSAVTGIVSVGPGLLDNYSIHQIEPIICLMGPEVARVQFTGTQALPAVTMEFKDGRRAHFSHHGWDCPFTLDLDLAGGGFARKELVSDYFSLFMKSMLDFFNGGPEVVAHKDTIAVIAAREAAIKAAENPGQWIATV